jgi:transitional endoplasmic reticulum ATPase
MDDFVNIWKSDSKKAAPAPAKEPVAIQSKEGEFYGKWLDQTSAKIANPVQAGLDALKTLYPDHHIVATTDYALDVLNFPGVIYTPIEDLPLLTQTYYLSFARASGLPGTLAESVLIGGFKLLWEVIRDPSFHEVTN